LFSPPAPSFLTGDGRYRGYPGLSCRSQLQAAEPAPTRGDQEGVFLARFCFSIALMRLRPRAQNFLCRRQAGRHRRWPLRRRHAGDRHRGHQGRPTICDDRLARHALQRGLCTWWNAIGCSITMPRKKRRKGAKEQVSASQSVPSPNKALRATPNIRGKGLQLELTVEDEGVFATGR